MAFWSDSFAVDSPPADPKRKFRFKVTITGISATSTDQVIFYAKTAAKPSFTINAAEHKYLNHTFYYPGSITWNEVAMTFVDPGDTGYDAAANFSALIQKGGYHPPTSQTDLATMSKGTAVGAIGSVIIEQINAAGNTTEKWTLWNGFISDLKYGDLAYGEDDLTELSVTFRYDWAVVSELAAATVESETGTEFFAASSTA